MPVALVSVIPSASVKFNEPPAVVVAARLSTSFDAFVNVAVPLPRVLVLGNNRSALSDAACTIARQIDGRGTQIGQRQPVPVKLIVEPPVMSAL